MRKLIVALCLMLLYIDAKAQTCANGLNGTLKIGPAGNYPTLTAALNALRTTGMSGPVTLELKTNYTSTTETFPLLFGGITCLSATTTLTIQPEVGATNLAISSPASGVFSFSNARHISIDGRPGGQGTTSQLKISSASQNTPAIQFIDDASYNRLMYLFIEGSNGNTQGNISFGASTQNITNGNSFNDISYCKIAVVNFNPNHYAIFSSGTLGKKNKGNRIRHCELYNFAHSGVALEANNEAWKIDSNHFYGSAWRRAAIVVNDTTSADFQIHGNFIGGSAPQCGGAPLVFPGIFRGILLHTSNNGYSSIQGNTIANLNQTAGNGETFIGIHLASGKFKCGDINGNTIGSESNLRSITYNMNSIFFDDFTWYGILACGEYNIGNADTAYIRNNKVCGIFAQRAVGGNAIGHGKIVGIGVTRQTKGFIEISANTIGHPSRFTAIQNTAGAGENLIVGIEIAYVAPGSQPSVSLVQNNLVANLNGSCTGIKVVDAKAFIRNNTIRGLYAKHNPTDNGEAIGINLSSAKDSCLVSGNTIHTLDVKSQSPYACGISIIHTSRVRVEKNNIHSFQATPTFNTADFRGIDIDYSSNNRIQNNMIRLGIDTAGNQITGDHSMRGISASATYDTISNNSVYIGGSGNGSTYALHCFKYPHVVSNNILYNAHGGSGNTKHYSFYYFGDDHFGRIANQVFSNYNLYHATGSNVFIAGYWENYVIYDATTIEQWRSLAKKDSNSMAYNPNFKNPTGNVTTGDLHLANPTPAEGQGVFDASITEDIDGEMRSAFSPTDIGADAGNFVLQDGDAPILTHDAFIGQAITDADTYTVKITDNGGGIDTTGNNKPRMWYRKKHPTTSNWVSVPGMLQSGTPQGGEWGFTPDLALTGASFNPGDSLEYYFIAQDKGAVINLGYSNKIGTAHTSVTVQTAAPSVPLRLLLMGYFPDTVYVGNGQTYPSLTSTGGFFEASNKMKFRPTATYPIVYITSDLLGETGIHMYKNLSPTRNKVKVQTPDAVLKRIQNAGNQNETLIRLYNVHDFVIDGSVNGSGRFLLFRNESTTPQFNTGVVSIINPDAVTLQNCIFESNMNQVYGAGVFVYSQQAKGLQFIGNLFRNVETGATAGLPKTALALNIGYGDTVVIRKNEFANFGTTGLSITQPVSAPTIRHMVDSNHFYYNSAITSVGSRTAIYYAASQPSMIMNNFVGGSAPFCGGNPWLFPTQVTGSVVFKGIELNLGKEGMHSVRNNVVRNIHITGFGYMLYGIYHLGDGSLRLEDNIIGDPTTDSSLVNKAFICGIYCLSTSSTSHTPEVWVKGNLVAGMTAPTVIGLEIGAPKGAVQNNKVTRIRTRGAATGIAGYRGLKVGIRILTDNEVSDLACFNAPGWTYGIEAGGGSPLPNETFIERNRIFGLQTNGTANSPISGIYMSNGQYKVRNNTISLSNGAAPTGAPLYGLHFQGSAGNVFQNELAYNTVYIGGTSNSTVRSAGLFVDGGSPIARFRNNLLYNERSGTGTHVAMAVLPATGVSAWTLPNIPNHNFYVTRDTSAVNEWRTGGAISMRAWRGAVRGDSASYASTTTHVPSTEFFADTANGNLHINNSDTLCWYVNGKGQAIAGISGDIDSASGVRSTTVASGATDIGADEFNTSTQPPVLLVTGRHQAGGVDTLSMNGKTLATITWGTSGTIPTLGEARYYSGVWPNDTTNNGTAFLARFFNAYWDIPATGGSNYTYSLTLHYDSSIVGKVTNVKQLLLNKRQSGTPGSWTELHPTIVDTATKTITVYNLTSFSEFTATDSLATLAAGVPLPDLILSSVSVQNNTIPTGTDFTTSFTETNTGIGPAGPHKVRFYLSADNVLTPGANGDTLLGSYDVLTSLAGGANTGAVNKRLFMPCTITPGNYSLFFVSDEEQQVIESVENNNTSFVSLTIAAGVTKPAPIIVASPSTTVCSGTTVSLTANSTVCDGCSYSWSNGNTNPVISVTATGTYTVTATNVCGSAMASQTVTVNPIPTVTITPGSTTVCLGSSVTLNASGANSYTWSGNALSATSGATVLATPTTTGVQQYNVTGTSNGCSQTTTVSIIVTAAPTITVSPADTSICAGSSVTITASGANTYSWSPATGLNIATGASVVAMPAATTTYTVTGTTGSCSTSVTRTVTVMPSVTTSVTLAYAGCPGSSLVFTATPVNGGTTPQYQWYVNNVLQAAAGNTFTLNNASNGTEVYVKMTSNANCPSPQTVSSATTTVNCITTAVPNIDALEKFAVSPNPTKGKLVLQLKLLRRKEVSFKVSNSNGKEIYRSETTKLMGDVTKVIDLTGAATGVYYLVITIGEQQFTEKIVVAR